MTLVTLSENEIISTLLALALLLMSAFFVGTLFEKMKVPRVGGEIMGGLLLGGTCLYYLFPDFYQVSLWLMNWKEKFLMCFTSWALFS